MMDDEIKNEYSSTTVNATYDGSVFHPTEPVTLPANTPVRLTVETVPTPPHEKNGSFLRTAMAMKLEGPPDWASNFDRYLYGEARLDLE